MIVIMGMGQEVGERLILFSLVESYRQVEASDEAREGGKTCWFIQITTVGEKRHRGQKGKLIGGIQSVKGTLGGHFIDDINGITDRQYGHY